MEFSFRLPKQQQQQQKAHKSYSLETLITTTLERLATLCILYLGVVVSGGHQVLDEGVQGGGGDGGPVSQASSRSRALLRGLLFLPRLSAGQMRAEATGSGEHGA